MSGTMAAYNVRDMLTREDLDAIVEVTYQAHRQPYFTDAQMLYPVFGYTTEDRAASIVKTKERLWSEHTQGDGSKRWFVVQENATSRIIGGVAWQYFESSPFPDGKPKLDFYWWPPGEARGFCEEMFQQMMVPHCLWMTRPHGEVTNMVVHPDHRNRGVGSLLMSAINRSLDQDGLEGFTQATELGRFLYESAGFRVLMKLDFFLPLGRPDSWDRLEHDLKMPPLYAMWRPPGGRVEPGERDRPWL